MSSRTVLALVIAVAVIGLVLIVVVPIVRSRQGRSAPPASTSAGPWYELHFTAPVYPDRAETRRGGLDERLVALIDATTKTLDVAIYDFDLPNVAQAMARAKQRGVNVRMVTDTDTVEHRDAAVQAAIRIVRDAGVPIVDDQRRAIMHHKFVVSDGVTVLTGSWNFTTGDTYRLNNNMAVLRSPDLAANFATEFEKMFGGRKFGPTKPKDKPHPTVTLSGARVETFFASEEDPTEQGGLPGVFLHARRVRRSPGRAPAFGCEGARRLRAHGLGNALFRVRSAQTGGGGGLPGREPLRDAPQGDRGG
jgi:phosphatidylserine/phosphatidylglycerophosphate/cardiolipin synthase-like enzyme